MEMSEPLPRREQESAQVGVLSPPCPGHQYGTSGLCLWGSHPCTQPVLRLLGRATRPALLRCCQTCSLFSTLLFTVLLEWRVVGFLGRYLLWQTW